jgi:protein SCO1/2
MVRLRPALAVAAALSALPAGGEVPVPDAEAAYSASQAAIGRQTSDHRLTDASGRPLALSDLRGRPLVVSLVYTSCASVCPVTTDRLREAVIAARRALGEDSFAVLTFGFDARGDRPDRLAGFAADHGLDLPGWHLATADAATIDAFLAELGFSAEAAAGGFAHVTQTTILDASGRVYRHVYGSDFPLPVFVEPLKSLVFGTAVTSLAPEALWDRVSFLCTVWDPARGAYRFDYSIFFGIGIGGLSLLLTGLAVLALWRGNRAAPARARLAERAE